MKKVFALALMTILFTGCSYKELVYVEAKCPRIEVLPKVPKISGMKDENGTIGGEQLDNLLQGASMLRKSETYYYNEVTKYNNKYTDGLDKQ